MNSSVQDKIVKLAESGCSQREICRQLKIGDSRKVKNILSHHDIQTSYGSHTETMKELYECVKWTTTTTPKKLFVKPLNI
jgi:hypothetical protein